MSRNKETYLGLIDDTLRFIRELMPEKEVTPPFQAIEPKPPAPAKTPQKKPSPPEKKKPVPSEFKLTPPPAPPKESFETMKRLLATIEPDLYLHDAPPPDEKAKQIKESWKIKSETPAVPILFQGVDYRSFLDNLAKAISLTFSPSRVIEIENGKKWDIFLESPQLKLILIPDHLLFSSNELLPYYKENPGQKTRFLGNVPLLLLPDLSFYFKDPYLKRLLWNVICQTLSQI